MSANDELDGPLPTPEDRPEAAVVVYDGQCGICRAQMKHLDWWDCQGRLSYVSLHDPQVAQRWPELSHDRLFNEMAIVDEDGRHYWGPEAVRFLTRRLRRLWWLAPVLHLPGSMVLWRPLYRWVARNRYWLSGRKSVCEGDSCSLHR